MKIRQAHLPEGDALSLPKGWEVKKLGEVCIELFAGGDVPKNFYSDVQTDEYSVPIYSNSEKNKGLYGFTNKARVLQPSITISARGTIGYSEIRFDKFYPAIRLIVATPNTDILDLSFLKYAIVRMDFKSSGTSIPQLTVPMIKEYETPVPPLSEQQRIVSLLDETFAAIEQAKANVERNLQNAKELFLSELNSIFSRQGEGVTEPAEVWVEKKLKNLTSKIGSGATPSGGQESYKESGISLIRSMNVHDAGFKEKNLAFIDDTQAGRLNNVTLEDGDILLNITGASVARCCIVPEKILPARVNQHVSIIRIKDNLIYNRLLHYVLTSKYYKDILLGIGEQGSTRQAITKVQLENFVVSFPKDIEIQHQIVERLDALSAATKKLEAKYQAKLDSLEELKKSVLEKAFRGEI